MSGGEQALERIRAARAPAFPALAAEEVATQLAARLAEPARIDQARSSLCGPASLLYRLALDARTAYAALIADLFVDGTARLGDWEIRPGRRCREFSPGPQTRIAACDWVGLASVKDATNRVFAYDSPRDQFPGITMPRHLVGWLRAAGYRDVADRTRLIRRGDAALLDEALARWRAGEKIWLLVDDRLFRTRRGIRLGPWPNHWVVLTDGRTRESMCAYSWGHERRTAVAPRGDGRERFVLGRFNGFVAASPPG